MKMKSKQIGLAAALSVFTTLSNAALLTYDNTFDLFLNPGLKTTYDFELLTGFPASTGTFTPIGTFDDINFDATVYETTASISGERVMTGANGTFTTANVDFSGLTNDVIGVGFWGLDLTVIGNEAIVLNVMLSDSTSQSYDITLNGAATLTPVYFGLYSDDLSQTITSISLFGTDDTGVDRAWLIDDLTVITAVPVPAAAWLFGSGLLGLIAISRRKT